MVSQVRKRKIQNKHKALLKQIKGNMNLNICQKLLNIGANPNLKDYEEKTPLHYAAEKGALDICKLLVSNGAMVNALDIYRISPLHLALSKNQIDVIEYLLKNGADLNLKVGLSNKRPLHYATEKNKLDICQLLLSNGADPNAKGTCYTKQLSILLLQTVNWIFVNCC